MELRGSDKGPYQKIKISNKQEEEYGLEPRNLSFRGHYKSTLRVPFLKGGKRARAARRTSGAVPLHLVLLEDWCQLACCAHTG